MKGLVKCFLLIISILLLIREHLGVKNITKNIKVTVKRPKKLIGKGLLPLYYCQSCAQFRGLTQCIQAITYYTQLLQARSGR